MIGESEVETLTGGLFREPVNVDINRAVFDYDLLVLLGPVFPHEVAGYSGGNKYLFPGISGGSFLHFTHWLGAVITCRETIGRKDTAVRRLLDRAAALLPVPRLGVSAVVAEGGGLAGLYAGPVEEAWSRAADLAAALHVRTLPRACRTVLGVAPRMYDELWVGGKVMYKLEPVVAEGGRLIIYAPHLREVSRTWGELIERVGYHVRDYFLRQWDRFRGLPWAVLAHSTHVKGAGSYQDGVERPRIEVVLATGLPEELCRKLNLGYLDPAGIRLEDYRDREGVLLVDPAGETLYRLQTPHYPTKTALSLVCRLRVMPGIPMRLSTTPASSGICLRACRKEAAAFFRQPGSRPDQSASTCWRCSGFCSTNLAVATACRRSLTCFSERCHSEAMISLCSRKAAGDGRRARTPWAIDRIMVWLVNRSV